MNGSPNGSSEFHSLKILHRRRHVEPDVATGISAFRRHTTSSCFGVVCVCVCVCVCIHLLNLTHIPPDFTPHSQSHSSQFHPISSHSSLWQNELRRMLLWFMLSGSMLLQYVGGNVLILGDSMAEFSEDFLERYCQGCRSVTTWLNHFSTCSPLTIHLLNLTHIPPNFTPHSQCHSSQFHPISNHFSTNIQFQTISQPSLLNKSFFILYTNLSQPFPSCKPWGHAHIQTHTNTYKHIQTCFIGI